MNLNGFLDSHGTTEIEISELITARLNLSSNDILFFSGSLVEELGNISSDVDAYVIIDSEKTDTSPENKQVTLEFDNFIIDIEIILYQQLEDILHRFERWALKPHGVFIISDKEWLLLHRLVVGKKATKYSNFSKIQQRVSRDKLARYKLDYSINYITRLQIDLAGLRSDGDWKSMVFVAQELLGYVIDCLLAAYGYTSPAKKWRIRFLEQVSTSWESRLLGRHAGQLASDQYLKLHQMPVEISAESVYAQTLRIVSFSRQIVPWSEWVLHQKTIQEMPGLIGNILQDKNYYSVTSCVPHLDIDVQFRYHEGRFLVYRVSQVSFQLEVSPEILSVLSLFDGQTPNDIMQKLLEQWFGYRNKQILQDVYTLLGFLQFIVRPFTDFDTVNKLISCRIK
jgi:hypothetical protein